MKESGSSERRRTAAARRGAVGARIIGAASPVVLQEVQFYLICELFPRAPRVIVNVVQILCLRRCWLHAAAHSTGAKLATAPVARIADSEAPRAYYMSSPALIHRRYHPQ